MPNDTLSDVLRSIRLRGAVFFRLQGSANWVVESPPTHEIAAQVLPGAEHVMAYHVVTRGSCWVGVVGEPPVRAECGDIVVFAHGDSHVLSSAPHMRAARTVNPQIFASRQGPPFFVNVDGDEAALAASDEDPAAEHTTLVCGFLGCDLRPFNPLIASLPRLMHEKPGKDSDDSWLPQFMRFSHMGASQQRPGYAAVLERVSEAMLLDLVRRRLARQPEGSAGWLNGLHDRFVGEALALLHGRPAEHWTIDRLSDEVGLSRSALHERFLQFTGQPPLQYLASWRMQLAAGRLRQSSASVTSIALEVGYESMAAFSRAFKRATGVSPTQWRRDALDAG